MIERDVIENHVRDCREMVSRCCVTETDTRVIGTLTEVIGLFESVAPSWGCGVPYCGNCGHKIFRGNRYCWMCGIKVDW